MNSLGPYRRTCIHVPFREWWAIKNCKQLQILFCEKVEYSTGYSGRLLSVILVICFSSYTKNHQETIV